MQYIRRGMVDARCLDFSGLRQKTAADTLEATLAICAFGQPLNIFLDEVFPGSSGEEIFEWLSTLDDSRLHLYFVSEE